MSFSTKIRDLLLAENSQSRWGDLLRGYLAGLLFSPFVSIVVVTLFCIFADDYYSYYVNRGDTTFLFLAIEFIAGVALMPLFVALITLAFPLLLFFKIGLYLLYLPFLAIPILLFLPKSYKSYPVLVPALGLFLAFFFVSLTIFLGANS